MLDGAICQTPPHLPMTKPTSKVAKDPYKATLRWGANYSPHYKPSAMMALLRPNRSDMHAHLKTLHSNFIKEPLYCFND